MSVVVGEVERAPGEQARAGESWGRTTLGTNQSATGANAAHDAAITISIARLIDARWKGPRLIRCHTKIRTPGRTRRTHAKAHTASPRSITVPITARNIVESVSSEAHRQVRRATRALQ